MASTRCRLMEAHDKRDLIEISKLIDLTDKPIGLTRDEIGWSRVKSNASNCICCCCNNSITLVTTDDSYILDHVPLDNIQFAQVNSSLQYLALSNHRKLAIVDLVDNDIKCSCYNISSVPGETKVVNLAAHGLTMNDIIFWRWLDDSVLAILSYEALYTCSVNQQQINHPAYTALSVRSRPLLMEKIFDIHQHLAALCQVTDIQRDISGNLYAISSLYSTGGLLKLNHSLNHASNSQATNTNLNAAAATKAATLRPSFGSVPSRLSQLANNVQSFDSLKSEHLFETDHGRQSSSPSSSQHGGDDGEICGLVQVYCKSRDRSQLIQAHAITFTSPSPVTMQSPKESTSDDELDCNSDHRPTRHLQSPARTILVAANTIADQMRVHFVEMATQLNNYSTSGQNASQSTRFECSSGMDFPTSIVCSHVKSQGCDNDLHVALITTKHGRLFVCSVSHSTILFNTSITNDIISNTVLESNTQGLMVICRNGQVLLVNLNLAKLMRLLEESKTLRHISSSHNILKSMDIENSNNGSDNNNNHNNNVDEKQIRAGQSVKSSSSSASSSSSLSTLASNQLSSSLETGLTISTKL